MTQQQTQHQRDLRTRENPRAIADLLQTIFAAELICPSEKMWLVSPWVSDIPILDNTAGQFSTLIPEFDRVPIRLSAVLLALADRGTQVTIAVRNASHNRAFVTTMREGLSRITVNDWVHEAPDLHEKGLLTAGVYLSGSLNFTFGGISLNEEVAHICTNPAVIAASRIAFEQRWNGEPS